MSRRGPFTQGTQDGMARLQRARAVLAGTDEHGATTHPNMFTSDVISFAHGEGIRRPHPSVAAAGIRTLLDTKSGSLENYLFLQRLKDLDRAISETFVNDGIPLDIARHVCIDCGTTRLFHSWLRCHFKLGDILLTAPGYYHGLASWCNAAGIELHCIPSARELSFKITSDAVREWYRSSCPDGANHRVRGLVLFSPTYLGAVYTYSELVELAPCIEENDLLVIEDTVFNETIFDRSVRAARLASISGMQDRVVTVSGGSKAYGLANIRIGWACGPEDSIEAMNQEMVTSIATVPHIAKVMALAALSAPRSYLDDNARECVERYALVSSLVESTAAVVFDKTGVPDCPRISFRPQAGHSILLDFSGAEGAIGPDGRPVCDSIDLAHFLLSRAKVALSPGLSMGFDGLEMRATFGCVGLEHTHDDPDELEYLTQNLLDWIEKLGRPASVRHLFTHSPRSRRLRGPSSIDGFRRGRTRIELAFETRVAPELASGIARAKHNGNMHGLDRRSRLGSLARMRTESRLATTKRNVGA